MKEMKKNYETPEVEILEINVEKGFANSPENGGTNIPSTDDW